MGRNAAPEDRRARWGGGGVNDQTGIFRKCLRCNAYRSIDDFVGLDHMCTPCMRGARTTLRGSGRYTPARSIVITEQGRAAIREVQPAA